MCTALWACAEESDWFPQPSRGAGDAHEVSQSARPLPVVPLLATGLGFWPPRSVRLLLGWSHPYAAGRCAPTGPCWHNMTSYTVACVHGVCCSQLI